MKNRLRNDADGRGNYFEWPEYPTLERIAIALESIAEALKMSEITIATEEK